MKIKLICLFIWLSIVPALAHEGHDDTGSLTGNLGPSDAPVRLSNESIANLGVQTVPVSLVPLAETITMPATVSLIPEQQAFITTRFDGLVRDIKVKAGQKVTKGQDLITVEPIAFGTMPILFKSPISGTVIQQNMVLGQPVSYQTIMLEIGDDSRMLLKGAVYENPSLTRIKPGQKATARVGIYPEKEFTGTLERIDAGPQADSRALHAYAIFDNADGALRPNLRGTLNIEIGGSDTPTIAVPVAAVLENNGVSFVFVREGNNFERREVQTGRKSGANIEILSGVLPEEDVVVQGNYQIQYLKPVAKPVTTQPAGK